MTQSAQEFIAPLTFQALSGHPVHTQLLNADEENAMGHINLARWADALVIAPATAHTIAKLSHGLADDLISTLYLVAECSVFLAPAMNQSMWNKPVTQANIANLQQSGVVIIGPAEGGQACGETGFGRMSEPEAICSSLLAKGSTQCLSGKSVLITAGPTREPLDPVRYITNRSSGKMGYALAQSAVKAGAQVTLVSGPVALPVPVAVEMIAIETAAQMHEAVLAKAKKVDVYIGAAAVADYTPATVQQQKIKKQGNETTIVLNKTRDILADVAQLPQNRPFTVGFAAETHELERYALSKLTQKKLDMVAANWVGRDEGGFEDDQNALQVFWHGGSVSLKMADKVILAEQLIKLIAEKLDEKNTA